MAGGVDVNIGADTRDFERSVKSGMQTPVEDAQGALDDYVKAADGAGSQLEGTFRDQQRQTVELRRDIDDLNRSIRDGSSQTYRKAGTEVDTFKRKSTEGFDEIKDSARSNAIEVGASFTGGMDQAVGGLQGFLAEFLAGFGPGGIIAGIGAAALLGTVSQALTDGQEAAEQQKAAIAALASEYIEAGKSGSRTFDDVAESIKNMATSDGSDVILTLQKAFDLAKESGADYQQVVQAIGSGSPREIGKAIDSVGKLSSATGHLSSTQRDYAGRVVIDNQAQLTANNRLRNALEQAEQQAKDAGRAQQLAAKAGLSDLQLKRDLLHQLEGAYDEAAGSTDDYLNKEKDTLNVGKYLEAMRKRQKALEDYTEALSKADLSPAARKFLEQQGADQAAAMLRGYQKATPRQKAELNRIWTTAGTENATNYQDAIGTKLKSKTIAAPKIEKPKVPAPDTSAIDAYLRQPRTVRLVVDAYTRDGKRIY